MLAAILSLSGIPSLAFAAPGTTASAQLPDTTQFATVEELKQFNTNDEDGVCTECGAEDPDYVEPGGIEDPGTGEEPGDEDPNAGKDPGTNDGNKQPAADEPGDGDSDDPKANANDQTTEPGAKAIQAGDAGVPLTVVALLLGALALAIASFALRRIRS